MINIKKIIIILILTLLTNCGYEPIYSKKNIEKSYSFSITSIEFIENSELNRKILNSIKPYMNFENKPKQIKLIIESSIDKKIVSKNKKGEPENFKIEIVANISVFENEAFKNKLNLKESFNYNNQSNQYDLSQYEKEIENNLVSEIANRLILNLYSLK